VGNLIGSVRITPQQVAPGESVQLQVLDPNGVPYASESSVTIAIDGVPVASRYYQFPTAGTRTVAIFAAGKGTTETTTVIVDVSGPPLSYRRTLAAPDEPAPPGCIPFLVLTPDLANPYQAAFSLATPPAAGAAAAAALAAAAATNAGKQPPPAPPPPKPPPGFTELQALFADGAGVLELVPQQPVRRPAPGTSYVWTFGDGGTATTSSPFVVHDYFPAITPGRIPFAFDVRCRIVHDRLTVTRTLVLDSPYGVCRRSGITVPHVTSDVFATLNSDGTSFSATLLVYNIESTEITLEQMAIVPVWNDPGATFPPFAFQRMATPVTIAPRSSSVVAVQVLRSDLQSAPGGPITGFVVAFQGVLASPEADPVSIDVALANRLRPPRVPAAADVGSSVRFSRHIKLRLQDQQLPAPQRVTLHPGPIIAKNVAASAVIADPVVRPDSVDSDAATNVVSVGLTTHAPTARQAGAVRQAVLSALSTANSSRGS